MELMSEMSKKAWLFNPLTMLWVCFYVIAKMWTLNEGLNWYEIPTILTSVGLWVFSGVYFFMEIEEASKRLKDKSKEKKATI